MLRRRLSNLRLYLDITLELVAHCCQGTIYCGRKGKVPQGLGFAAPIPLGSAQKRSRGDDMQIAADVTTPQSISGSTSLSDVSTAPSPAFSQHKVIRRNGAVVGFEPGKISVAVTKAFLAVEGGHSAASARIRELVAALTDAVVSALVRRQPAGGTFHIEDVQDQVELALMRSGEHEVARAYVLYREKRAEERAQEKQQKGGKAPEVKIFVIENGVRRPLDLGRLPELVKTSCAGLTAAEPERILKATQEDLYDGVPMEEV